MSLGANVSVGVWTFLSAPMDLPRETSVTVTAATGTAVGMPTVGAAVATGSSVFLHAAPEIRAVNPRASAASVTEGCRRIACSFL